MGRIGRGEIRSGTAGPHSFGKKSEHLAGMCPFGLPSSSLGTHPPTLLRPPGGKQEKFYGSEKGRTGWRGLQTEADGSSVAAAEPGGVLLLQVHLELLLLLRPEAVVRLGFQLYLPFHALQSPIGTKANSGSKKRVSRGLTFGEENGGGERVNARKANTNWVFRWRPLNVQEKGVGEGDYHEFVELLLPLPVRKQRQIPTITGLFCHMRMNSCTNRS